MHLSDTEAAQRVADNDNLVGELVIHLRTVSSMLQASCMVITERSTREMALSAVRDAQAVIARAQGDAQ